MSVDKNVVDYDRLLLTKYNTDYQEETRRVVRVVRKGERRGAFRVYVWKGDGKKPTVRPGRRWEDNIESSLQETG